ncbi:hypothetical protein D3C85_1841360 [compost metagenome]
MIRERLSNRMNIEFMADGDGNVNGIGMFNVCKLIQLHYVEQYGISVDSVPGEGTSVVLSIPRSTGRGLEVDGDVNFGS